MINKKLALVIVFLSSLVFAQAQQTLPQSLTDLCSTTQSFFGMAIVLFIILAIPLVGIGLFLYLKKKDNKWLNILGMVLTVIGVGVPLLLVIIYLLVPVIISSLVGGSQQVNC